APGYQDAAVEPLSSADTAAYTVTLEPHGKRWLFALDLPVAAPPGGRMLPGRQLLASTPVRERRRYRAESFPRYRTGPLSGAERSKALDVPRASSRVRELAAAWQTGDPGDTAVVDRALQHFATGGYAYTLSPPVTGPEYVEPFLFDTRRGFCEHFAGSFALLMRLAGVPSRVVVGYLGGERNPVGEFWVVRQAQAHAWAEVWLAGRGWVRVDPTAVVQPERLTGLVDNRAGAATGVRYVMPPPDWVRRAVRRLHTLWGAAENTWDQWVLGYDVARQARLLRRLGVSDPTWRHLAAGLGVCAAASLALLAALAAWRGVPRGDPLQRVYGSYCRRLGRRGLPRRPAETPLAYSLRAAQAWPEHAPQIAAITALYLQARYGPRPVPDAARRLRRAVVRLRLGPRGECAVGRQRRQECL
ncbi:MAG TPA: transglutaminaseTgpA domain-containing protein, partial [Deferrisomatales bacterium]|nr:transglutaminaseTgpA domain-containing protein [Deferrisomatales bacterium]